MGEKQYWDHTDDELEALEDLASKCISQFDKRPLFQKYDGRNFYCVMLPENCEQVCPYQVLGGFFPEDEYFVGEDDELDTRLRLYHKCNYRRSEE